MRRRWVTAVLVLRFEVNAPEYAVQGIKECLAMAMERYGDVRLVSVDVAQDTSMPQQMSMNAWAAQRGYKEAAMRRR